MTNVDACIWAFQTIFKVLHKLPTFQKQSNWRFQLCCSIRKIRTHIYFQYFSHVPVEYVQQDKRQWQWHLLMVLSPILSIWIFIFYLQHQNKNSFWNIYWKCLESNRQVSILKIWSLLFSALGFLDKVNIILLPCLYISEWRQQRSYRN